MSILHIRELTTFHHAMNIQYEGELTDTRTCSKTFIYSHPLDKPPLAHGRFCTPYTVSKPIITFSSCQAISVLRPFSVKNQMVGCKLEVLLYFLID